MNPDYKYEFASRDNILDLSNLKLEGDFETQVSQLLLKVRLSRTQVENLQALLNDVERTLRIPWGKGIAVHTFGSIVTGLGIATSDVDCYVDIPEWVKSQNKLVYKAKAYLESKPRLFTELTAIPFAKVPIVKCYHLPTKRHCDINFTSLGGVRNSKLLAYLLNSDPRAIRLAILAKYWSKIHNLTGTNLMPNYVLTLLVIFYLQHMKILPPVHELQYYVNSYMVDDWNMAFNEIFHFVPADTSTLYELLGGFFEYYASFDFENQIISIFSGYPIQKQTFATAETTPPEYTLYRHNVSNDVCTELRMNTKMCVQDVFEHSRNCAVAVHQKIFDIVMKYIKASAQLFREEDSNKYLKAILTIVHIKKDDVTIKNKKHKPRGKARDKIMKNKHLQSRKMFRQIKKNGRFLFAQHAPHGQYAPQVHYTPYGPYAPPPLLNYYYHGRP